jgi:hypothetical protein
MPGARVARAVAANAGWYAMPDFGVRFPYGLRGSGLDAEGLRQAFGRRLVVLVGERDVDTDDDNLRKTPEAMAQGANRRERATNFMKAAREQAKDLRARLMWRLRVLKDVRHSNTGVARVIQHEEIARALFR